MANRIEWKEDLIDISDIIDISLSLSFSMAFSNTFIKLVSDKPFNISSFICFVGARVLPLNVLHIDALDHRRSVPAMLLSKLMYILYVIFPLGRKFSSLILLSKYLASKI